MSDIIPPPKRRAMEPHENDTISTSPEPDTKRRKLRKGTKSCWDCKKRKVKCTFDSTSDTVCIGCRRRGAHCISQDQPEEEYFAENGRDQLLDRIQRVEHLLEKLVEVGRNVERDVALAGLGLPGRQGVGHYTPPSDSQSLDSSNSLDRVQRRTQDQSSCEPQLSTPDGSVVAGNPTVLETDEFRKLSEELVKAFPSQNDMNIICKSDYIATFYCHQIFTKSPDRPEHEAFDFVNDFAKIPDPSTTHPILMAKRMLIFALFLQYFRSQRVYGLAEHPLTVMDRLVDTVVRLVTTNETIVGCIDGLECIILEGVFQSHGGNLRRAWIAFRKAIVVAQLMKMDLPSPPLLEALGANTKVNPKFMWFRIIYMDSYLSLMLGLPHGGQETNMENEVPGEKPSCRLERVHTLVARRIVDRNRRNSVCQDFTTTQELDRELLKVAKTLPDKFWLAPDFTTLQPNSREAFWEIMRLCDQLHHFNLVHLLHLPYLLRYDKQSSYHTYSQITCVNASREILSRFTAFRNFNRNMSTVYCRTADFFAFMAAMTLLLAHIDSHRYQSDDWRAHQRLGDRAMVEQLLEGLEKTGKETNDSLTKKSAEQLRSLLEIENDAARGMDHTAHNTVCCLEEHCGELQLSIPYFGIIKIGREGITKDCATSQLPIQVPSAEPPHSVHVANHLFSAAGFGDVLHENPPNNSLLPLLAAQSTQESQISLGNGNVEESLRRRQSQYPGLAASVNDWAFQGVDAAFFDSLIRGTGEWEQPL